MYVQWPSCIKAYPHIHWSAAYFCCYLSHYWKLNLKAAKLLPIMFTPPKKIVSASHLSSALPSRSSWFISFQKHQFQLEPSASAAGAVGDAPSPFPRPVQCSLLRSKSCRGGTDRHETMSFEYPPMIKPGNGK